MFLALKFYNDPCIAPRIYNVAVLVVKYGISNTTVLEIP